MLIELIQRLLNGTSAVVGVITGLGLTFLYWIVRKEAKAELQNKFLQEDLEDVKTQAHEVGDVQRKEAEIAAQPTPDRDAIYDWLRRLSEQDRT